MGVIIVKCAPQNEVVNFTKTLPTSSIASGGYSRSLIMASNIGWFMKPIAFLKFV